MGVRGGEARWGEGWGGERHKCCAGGNSSISRPGPYMSRIPPYPSCLHVRSHMSTPAQPFNNPTTLFAIFLPRLTHSRPPPALQALNPALISLSLKPSPSSNASLQPRFSLLYPSVSLPLPSLPSTDHVPWVCVQPLGWWGGGYRCQCFDPMKADIQNRAADAATGHPGIWTTGLCVKPGNVKSRQAGLTRIELTVQLLRDPI